MRIVIACANNIDFWCEQLWLHLYFDASITMTTSITVSVEGEREVIVVEVPQQAAPLPLSPS